MNPQEQHQNTTQQAPPDPLEAVPPTETQQSAPVKPLPDQPLEQPEYDQPPEDHIEWQASEYIHHEKSFGWYALFILATVVIIALMYLILEDILSVVVIALMAIALGIFANRKPRILSYAINSEGVMVGEKKYSYESFRSFSVMNDGGMQTIVVDPMQKFLPPITIYCDPQDIDNIAEVLSYYLPHEDKELDWVDRFAKRIRF